MSEPIVRVLATVAFVAASLVMPARADEYPSRPIRLIVSTEAGGAVDVVARLLAERMADGSPYRIVVENRPGAGGIIGTEAVAKAAPDGYTLGIVTTSFTTNASTNRKLPYSVEDFTPVALVGQATYALVCHPSLPVHSVSELIAYAKQRPGEINYASLGTGASVHLAMEIFDSMAGIQMTHIPYKGPTEAINAIVGGHVQLMISSLTSVLPLAKADRLRVLAVTSSHRASDLPDVPTIGEIVPGYAFNNWFGVLAPRRTPNEIVAALNAAIRRVLAEPDFRTRLLAQGAEASDGSAEQLAKTIQKEMEDYASMARKLGIQRE
jgi:tripartite-type tricarboxylate transporter receptor subunit TctC